MTKIKTLALTLALMIAVSICVSCAPSKDAIIATVDGENIYKWELDLYYSRQAPYFEQTNGLDLNSPKNREQKKKYQQQLAENLAGELACVQEAKKLGFDQLSPDELAATDAEFQELHDQNISEFMQEFASDKDPAARAEQKFQNMMKEQNLSEEKVKQNINQNKVLQKLFEHLSAGANITEQEIKDKYEDLLASQQTEYAERPELYGEQTTGVVCFVPPGYIRVKHILIGHDEETLAKLQNQQSELYDLYNQLAQAALTDGDTSPAAKRVGSELVKAQDAMEKDLTENIEKLRPAAEDVLKKAEAGDDFDSLIEAYNTDPGMRQFPGKRDGYYMCQNSDFVDEFKNAAFELKNVGDISGLVESFYGFHIIKLLEKVESRVVPYEDVKEQIRFQLQSNMDIDTGMGITLRIKAEREIKYFPENY